MATSKSERVTDRDYRELLALRTTLRQFLHWSEDRALAAGVTPAQHQLLLAVRGHDGDDAPTIADLAEHLLLRHHSVVGLVDRAEEAKLVTRHRDANDRRVVRVALTNKGARILESLSAAHLDQIKKLGLLRQPDA